ncbi:MAG: hypothetical protein M1422_02490 [Candidatus Thermoplasmatota archaeon]|nr:hypothetical protein [Candidatus Thermoplasmatota archaeon]
MLRKSLTEIRASDFEPYLANAIVQPYCYYQAERLDDVETVTVSPRSYLERETFERLRQTLKTKGFKYKGNGVFEGKESDALRDVMELFDLKVDRA